MSSDRSSSAFDTWFKETTWAAHGCEPGAADAWNAATEQERARCLAAVATIEHQLDPLFDGRYCAGYMIACDEIARRISQPEAEGGEEDDQS